MALNCGIVGLPNVGKTAIFSALTSAPAEMTSYQFATKNPNIGIATVPDKRLAHLASVFNPRRVIPATVEFVDIAGLVSGSSKGEGLGNRFLSHIREMGVIAHVVRCFDDENVLHISDTIDPERDIEIIDIELALADLDTLARRRERAEHALRVKSKADQKAAVDVLAVLAKISPALEDGRPIRSLGLSAAEMSLVYDCHFITAKSRLYVCNVDEDGIKAVLEGSRGRTAAYVDAVKKRADAEGAPVVVIPGKFEAELIAITDPEEKRAFLGELGLAEGSLGGLIRAAYGLLGLCTFFTKNEDECRAWTIHAGDSAPKAARAIHTDIERGFIKAEVYNYRDLAAFGSVAKIKEAGKYRIEGKEYIVEDGDVIFFRFNVS